MQIGETFTHVCCLYPTTPLLTSEMISQSFDNHLSLSQDFSGFTFSACIALIQYNELYIDNAVYHRCIHLSIILDSRPSGIFLMQVNSIGDLVTPGYQQIK